MGTYPIHSYLSRKFTLYTNATLCWQYFIAPYLSIRHRLYLHLTNARCTPLRLPTACNLLLYRIVVEPLSIRNLAADCPLLQCLGFNLASSIYFFLLSQLSHLSLFHLYVVVYIALGFSSSSMCYFSNIS